MDQGDVGGSLSLGNTSKFLQDLGVSQGNVYWDKAKIVASKKNHPDLMDGVMKQVPQLLDDPLLVMQSRTGVKRFAFIDNVLDDQGKPVLAALVLEPTGAGNRVVKFTKIPGGNENGQALQRLIKSGDVLYQKPGKSMSGMEVADSRSQWIEGEAKTKRGSLTGKLDGLKPDERSMVEDLLNAGKDVEIIPRSNMPNYKTPDFSIGGVKTELKTLNGTSLNTPVTRIQDGFEQGAQTVIIDGRKTGLTLEQANTVMNRALGKYGGTLPGKVEIWTTEGILRR